jgi:beta-phosphoglucomutase-like phosphatase (HAD superfamily)
MGISTETGKLRAPACTGPATPPSPPPISELSLSQPKFLDSSIEPHDLRLSARTIKQHVEGGLETGPYRFFFELPERVRAIISDLSYIKGSVNNLGRAAPILNEQRRELDRTISELSMVPSFCDHYPHCPDSFGRLSSAVDLVQRSLARLYCTASGGLELVTNELEVDIARLRTCANEFFVYAPRKYGLYSYAHTIDHLEAKPLSLKYSVLKKLTNDPKAMIFDIDDCILISETHQRMAWDIALRAWVSSRGSKRYTDYEGAERLCRTVAYCLENDCSDRLLELLTQICEKRGLTIEVVGGHSREQSLELTLTSYRAEVLSHFVQENKVQFASGALNMITQCFLDERRLAFCTNSPGGVAERVLQEAFRKANAGAEFEDLFPETCRIYGDTTPQRKPFPLMWLVAAKALEVRPSETIIFDNSLNNCIGASQLENYFGHPEIEQWGEDLLRQGEQFAGVVGITNGLSSSLHHWQQWATSNPTSPVKAVLKGLDSVIFG